MTDDIVTPLPKNTLRLDCGCLLFVNSPKHHGVTLHCKDHRTKPEIENDEEGLQEKIRWQTDEIERLGELLFQEIYRGQQKLDEIERLRAIVKDLHDHLGEALYSDDWSTREYAIASYSRYEKEPF